MSVGLIALFDDVAAIARAAAASVDDIAAHAAKAGAKSAGVVIDDAAVTPRYVTGLDPARELPMIWRIARGSLRNKLLILLPAALALGALAPWAITPLLMLGGLYLCYEGFEKLWEAIAPHPAHAHEAKIGLRDCEDPARFEAAKVAGAVRTDFILSAEIMAIALAALPAGGQLWERALILAIVGVGITALVYGAVALIVKADDAGLALAASPRSGPARRALGRGMIAAMPPLLKGLSGVGTAAMIWVGGGILVHGLAEFGVAGPEHAIEAAAHLAAGLPAAGLLGWAISATGAGLVGLAAGAATIPLAEKAIAPLWARLRVIGETDAA